MLSVLLRSGIPAFIGALEMKTDPSCIVNRERGICCGKPVALQSPVLVHWCRSSGRDSYLCVSTNLIASSERFSADNMQSNRRPIPYFPIVLGVGEE